MRTEPCLSGILSNREENMAKHPSRYRQPLAGNIKAVELRIILFSDTHDLVN